MGWIDFICICAQTDRSSGLEASSNLIDGLFHPRSFSPLFSTLSIPGIKGSSIICSPITACEQAKPELSGQKHTHTHAHSYHHSHFTFKLSMILADISAARKATRISKVMFQCLHLRLEVTVKYRTTSSNTTVSDREVLGDKFKHDCK